MAELVHGVVKRRDSEISSIFEVMIRFGKLNFRLTKCFGEDG